MPTRRSAGRVDSSAGSAAATAGNEEAPGREAFAWETTVGEQRDANIHVKQGKGEEEFVVMREARDATLPVPAMLLPALQVNIRGGRVPDRIQVPVTWDD